MTAGPTKKMWPGRAIALAGIILVTLNTRAAITSLSPIYDEIGKSFPITPIAQGVLGMLPPLAFALFGWLAPRLIPRIGLEKSLLLAMILVCAGITARSFSNNIWMFGMLFTVCLAGMGMSNVLLPPVIKVYFPDRIGMVTSIYTGMVSVSASIPSLLAVPITQSSGWRFSTGVWAGLAFVAALPWVRLLKGNQKSTNLVQHRYLPAWRWLPAWALAIVFGVGSINIASMMSWLPKILTSTAGVNQAEAGTMLSILTAIGFVPTMLVPMILFRIKHPILVILFLSICLVFGYLGLAYYPQWVWIWVTSIGIGLVLIPVCLTLINLRSRTADGSAALSGFVQGAGYLMGAAGPFVIGGLNSLTGGWIAALWFLTGMALVGTVAGVFSVQPKFIEDA